MRALSVNGHDRVSRRLRHREERVLRQAPLRAAALDHDRQRPCQAREDRDHRARIKPRSDAHPVEPGVLARQREAGKHQRSGHSDRQQPAQQHAAGARAAEQRHRAVIEPGQQRGP